MTLHLKFSMTCKILKPLNFSSRGLKSCFQNLPSVNDDADCGRLPFGLEKVGEKAENVGCGD